MQFDHVQRLGRMLAVNEQVSGFEANARLGIESTLPMDAVPRRPADILDRVDSVLSAGYDTGGEQWKVARENVMVIGGKALEKMAQRNRDLTRDQAIALEAIVIADGTRPSFALSGGRVSPNDPFLGKWDGEVAAADAAGIHRLAAAVGRIEPANGHASRFVGTGTLIDRDRGLVLTNYHVLAAAGEAFGVPLKFDGNHVRVEGVLEIDFIAEADSLDSNRFRVVEGWLPQDFGETFAGLDAAVLRIDPASGDGTLPAEARILSAQPKFANGAAASLAVIGFPAEPGFRDGTDVDWNFVIRKLFANQFGVKRLAPGRFTSRLSSHGDDRRGLAIGYDATTFGGASGSLVAAWLDQDTPGFALHFGGLTESSNYGLSFAVARKALEDIGVRFA